MENTDINIEQEKEMNSLISDLQQDIKTEAKEIEITETNEQPKRKRGRPRKIKEGNANNVNGNEVTDSQVNDISGTTETKPTETTTGEIPKKLKEKNGKDKLADILSDYQEVKVNEVKDSASVQQVNLSQNDQLKINGSLLLILCDAFAPLLIKLVFGMFQPELKKVPVNKIRLTREQKEALEPIADKCAEYVFKETNPLAMFVVSIGACYYSNAMEHIK